MKKQLIIFISIVFILFVFNKVLMGDFIRNSSLINTNELINDSHVNSQQLFDKSWKIIKNDFYDPNLNGAIISRISLRCCRLEKILVGLNDIYLFRW